MSMLLLLAQSLALLLGSIVVAAIALWAIYRIAARMNHPEIAAPLIVLISVAAVLAGIVRGQFLGMAVAFVVVGSLPLEIDALEWRRRLRSSVGQAHKESQR